MPRKGIAFIQVGGFDHVNKKKNMNLQILRAGKRRNAERHDRKSQGTATDGRRDHIFHIQTDI